MSNGNSAEASTSPSPVPSSVGNNAPKFGTLVPNRVFVGGISASTTEQDLHELFSKFGKVKATKVISDRAGVSKGYGFVTFETEEEARKLTQEADNVILKERKLNIAPAIKKQISDLGYIKPFSPRLVDGANNGTVIGTNGTVFFSNGQPYAYTGAMPVMASPTDFSQTISPAAASLPSYPAPVPHSGAATAVTQAPGNPASTYPTQFVYPQPVYFPQAAYQQYPQAAIQPQWGSAQQQWRWVTPGSYPQPEPCSPNHSQSPSQSSTVKSSQNCPANNAFTHLPSYPNSFLPPFSINPCSQSISLDPQPTMLASSFMVDNFATVSTTCTTTAPSTCHSSDKEYVPYHDFDGTLLVRPLRTRASSETNSHHIGFNEEPYNGYSSSPTLISSKQGVGKKMDSHVNSCKSPARNDKCVRDGNWKPGNYRRRPQASSKNVYHNLDKDSRNSGKKINRPTPVDFDSSKSESLRSSPDVLTAFVENAASSNLNSDQASVNGYRYPSSSTDIGGGWPVAQPYYVGWPNWCPQHNLPAPFVQQPNPYNVPVWQLGPPVKMLPSSSVNSENSAESWETLESPTLRPPVRSSTPNNICGQSVIPNGATTADNSTYGKECPKEDFGEHMSPTTNPYPMAGGNPIMMMPMYQQLPLVNPPWYQWGYPIIIQQTNPNPPAAEFCPYTATTNPNTKLPRQQSCLRVPYHLQSPPPPLPSTTKVANTRHHDRNVLNICGKPSEASHVPLPFSKTEPVKLDSYPHTNGFSAINISNDNYASLPRFGSSFRCLRRVTQLPDDKCALLPLSPPLTPLHHVDQSDHISIY